MVSTRPAVAVVVIISADVEWRAVRAMFPSAETRTTPFGEWLTADMSEWRTATPVVFVHGGWGKIAAAASTQYVIERWRPDLLVNLGTCGGFAGLIEPGEIILATRADVYDVLELMGDPDEALSHYATDIDLTWLGTDDPYPVRRMPLVSADRDLAAAEIPHLAARFGAVAGDWESGAIAWVAARNGVRCLIPRGVTDLVGGAGGDAYDGTLQIWSEAAEWMMRALVEQLPGWLRRAAAGHGGEGVDTR